MYDDVINFRIYLQSASPINSAVDSMVKRGEERNKNKMNISRMEIFW